MALIKNKYIRHVLVSAIAIIFILIAFNAKKRASIDWHSTYWADAAGYYIYLPATFIYGYTAEKYPDGLWEKMGGGFYIDKKENKLFTKYTMGLALLTAPFFLIFHFIAIASGSVTDGFSPIYNMMPFVASPLYLLIGLLFLFKFLRHYVNKWAAIISILAVSAGTNLYYFTFVSPYMTHVYSFAVFSFFLLSLKKYFLSDCLSNKYLIFIALSSGLIFLLRPTNLIVLLLIPLLDVNSLSSFKIRIVNIFKLRRLFLFTFIFIITILPQLIYWKFSSGSYLFYSYGDEGFKYLTHPKFLEVLLAPLNGMFLYNPIIFIFFIALIFSIFKKCINSILIFIITLISLYIISSWDTFYYGCGYGCRPFIEYLTLLALPFAQFIQNSKKIIQKATIVIGLYLIYFNLSLIYGVFIGSQCFLGEYWDKPEYITGVDSRMRLWNWHEYRNYLERAKIFPFQKHHYIWKNNFEPDFKDYFLTENKRIKAVNNAPSGKYASTAKSEFSDGLYYAKGEKICSAIINQIDVSAQINQVEVDSNAFLVCQINYKDTVYYWEGKKVIDLTNKQKEWAAFEATFMLPRIEYATYSVYFWSPQKKDIMIDDLEVDFKY